MYIAGSNESLLLVFNKRSIYVIRGNSISGIIIDNIIGSKFIESPINIFPNSGFTSFSVSQNAFFAICNVSLIEISACLISIFLFYFGFTSLVVNKLINSDFSSSEAFIDCN